jgi:hypothetical protein
MDGYVSDLQGEVVERMISVSFFVCSRCESRIGPQLLQKSACQFRGISSKQAPIAQFVDRQVRIPFGTTYIAFHSNHPLDFSLPETQQINKN